MSLTRIKKSEPCAFEDCGSRRFYLGDDGYTYCDQGHQQSERGTVITEDTGELVIHGQKSRRKDSDAESRTSRASSFSGADAFEHYLLCLQLILRKQLRWLIDIQKLPPELESLTKDLWALRLQKIQGKVSYDSETDTEALSSQAISSQSESESASASQSTRRSQKDTKVKEGTPTLVDIISLCYVALLLLRIPVTVGDLHEWINNGELPYYRASRETPVGMRERLPPRLQLLLEPQELLHPETLHRHVLSTAVMLNKDFGMTLPPLNISLILYRWIRTLVLPLEVFAASQRLMKLLDLDLSTFIASKTNKNVALRYQEAQLMALIVVGAKLLFPFDSIERRPYQPTDLSSLSLDWDAWAKLQAPEESDSGTAKPLPFHEAFDFDEAECLSASDQRLDAYLDWYQDNIAREEVREHGRAKQDAEFRRTLFQMFPMSAHQPKEERGTSIIDSEDRSGRLGESHERFYSERTVHPTESRSVNRIGSFYRRYRTVEELSGPANLLFEKASALAGVSVENMVLSVFWTERKLQKFEEVLRKNPKTSGAG